MKQSYLLFLYAAELFPGSVIINNRALDAMLTKGAVCPFLSNDCFECLSPHKITA